MSPQPCEPHRFQCVWCGHWVHDPYLMWFGVLWPVCHDGCKWHACGVMVGCDAVTRWYRCDGGWEWPGCPNPCTTGG